MAMLPGPTQFMLNVADFTRRYAILVVTAVGFLLWLDAKMFERIYRRRGRRYALVYFWVVTIILAVIPTVLIVLGMTLPWLRMGEIV